MAPRTVQALLHAIAHAPLNGDAQRVFHGRGGLHPGCEHLALDLFPPVWVLTAYTPLTDNELATVHRALTERVAPLPSGPGTTPPLTWVYQCRASGTPQPLQTRLMAGEVPQPHVVSEAGARYAVHVLRGQNHGLFLDMAEGRHWVRMHASAHPGLTVLNLFAYTGAFSVAALLGGARRVVNVDMSRGAMAQGQHNHGLNGVQERARFLVHDVFSSWGKIQRSGPHGLVVLDPPSHQKGSFVAHKDYARLVCRLPDLLAPGGHVLMCLNAPERGSDFLHELVQTHAPALRFVHRLPNPPAFADCDPERALKALVFEMPANRPGTGAAADAW